jgi:hypothetical protein
MSDNTHNGWTNYATWRVNLEMIDGLDPRDMGWRGLDRYDLGQAIKEWALDMLETDAREGLALDYARAFLSDVNWREIADHMADDYELDENEDEDAAADA